MNSTEIELKIADSDDEELSTEPLTEHGDSNGEITGLEIKASNECTRQESPTAESFPTVIRIPSTDNHDDPLWVNAVNSSLPPGTSIATTSDGQILLITSGDITANPISSNSHSPTTVLTAPAATTASPSSTQNNFIPASALNSVIVTAGGAVNKNSLPPNASTIIVNHQRPIFPKLVPHVPSVDRHVTRDEKQRQTHNAVERRRRDKINKWIMNLAALIPNVDAGGSKGGILSKACDYVAQLKHQNESLQHNLDQLSDSREALAEENAALRREIEQIHSLLQDQGIILTTSTTVDPRSTATEDEVEPPPSSDDSHS